MSRLALIGYGLLGLALSTAAAFGAGYLKGKAAAEREAEAAGWRQFAAAVETAADVGRQVLAIGEQLRDQLAESHQREAGAVRTVTRIVHEHPDFAAVRRPPELERVRRDQLEAINRAAEADRLRR